VLETRAAGVLSAGDAGLTSRPPTDSQSPGDGDDLARGAATNTLVLLAANFRAVFTFLIARLLGEAALGRFGLAFAATDLLSKAGMLGLDNAVVPLIAPRAVSGDVRGCRRVFHRAAAVAAVASVLVSGASILVVEWLVRARGLDAFAHGGSLMLLALPGIAVARISTGASRALWSMRNEFYSRGIVETWVTTAVFVLALAVGLRDTAPALAVVGGTSAAGLVAFVLAERLIGRRLTSATKNPLPAAADVAKSREISGREAVREKLGGLLRFSIPTGASSLINVLVVQADVLLLGFYVNRAPGVTAATFGVFCAAAEIAVGLRKVRQVFDPIFAPVVATRAAADPVRLRETVAGPGRWVLAAQLPLVGVLILSGGTVLGIYGSGFRQGAQWLALLALAHGANAFAGLVETLLMIERPTLNVVNAAGTVAVQLVAGVVLIPMMGVTGAALAMCLGFSAQGVLRFLELRHVFGWSWPWRSLVRPAAAFTLAFLPAVIVRVVTASRLDFLSGALFLALYVAAWRWLGADPADREIWHRLRARR
jgi:O-antigen/teichoic acid export membrane protein